MLLICRCGFEMYLIGRFLRKDVAVAGIGLYVFLFRSTRQEVIGE